MILWIVKRHFRATEGFFVPCRRSMRASMTAHAVRRDPRPRERTAAMRSSDGGEEELRAVVARRTAVCVLALLFVDRVALIMEVRPLRMPITVFSFLRWPIDFRRRYSGA